MSILIKGMEMPKSCFYCPFREKVNPDDYVCMALNKEFEETFSLIVGKRHKDCPLVRVPPHSDLIDRDKLREKEFIHDGDVYAVVMSRDIRNAATIIPADKDVVESEEKDG